MKAKKGISLITLIITIIIIIILAAAIILSLSSNNPISKASEAAFKKTVKEYEGQLALFVASEYASSNGMLDITTINATKDSGTYTKDSDILKMKDIITIMKEPDQDLFEIKEGKLIFIGTDEEEQEWAIDVGASNDSVTAMPIDIEAGYYNTAIIMSDGTVKMWGDNTYGQLGNGTTTNSNIPITVPGLTNVKQIAIGERHTLALLNDGTVKAWGYNDDGELGDGTNVNSNVPISVCKEKPDISSIANLDVEGIWSDFFLSNTLKIRFTSDESWGQSGFIIAKIKYIEGGVTYEEKLETPIMNLNYSDNQDVTYTISKPSATSISVNFSLLDVEEEYDYVTILNSSDEVLQRYTGSLYIDSLSLIANDEVLTDVKEISAGEYFSLALLNDGTVKVWGYNNNGQLGDGTNISSYAPINILGLTDVKQISAGHYYAIALLNSGTVKEWGYNGNTTIITPSYIESLSNVKQISAGEQHSLALLDDETVKAWGYNGMGQLGDGTTNDSYVPIISLNLAGVKQVEAGGLHSLALLDNGTVKAWGYNNDGELGIGTNVYYINTPTIIPDLINVKKIQAGSCHSAALLNDGTVKVWGANFNGQLGDGTNEDKNVPVEISVDGNDRISPIVSYSNNGGNFLSTIVNVSDTGGSNIDESTLQYVWDQQNVTMPSSGWTVFINGAEITNDNTSGTYYLWVKASDNAGNDVLSKTNAFTFTEPEPELGDVNKPALAAGMTAKKWDGSSWITVASPDTDTSWYNYTNKEWANAQTADGSMWVWIPRYEYMIPTPHSSVAQTIEVNFLNATSTTATSGYTVHPAFTFGSTQLTGIWVAKFEASGTTSAIDIKPNAITFRNIDLSSIFTECRNMEVNSRYGWGTSGTGIDTHLTKNIEWGAVAYLSSSIYGKTGEVWINPTDNYLTGQAGASVNEDWTTDTYAYDDMTYGIQASTTGNIYGVYDMNGGADEYVAAYVDNGKFEMNNGISLVNASNQYKDVYISSGDTYDGNYVANSNRKGDAVYETSSSSYFVNSWYSSASCMPYSTDLFFTRGGIGNYTGGVFAFSGYKGYGNSSIGFRPVITVSGAL